MAAQLDRQVSTILAQRLALRRKEAVMGRLVDTVFDGIVVFDDQGKVLSWNRAAERMFGDPIEQVRGKAVRGVVAAVGAQLCRRGYACPTRTLRQTKRWQSLPCGGRVSATEMEGGRMGVAVVRDITKRKADEELARQALHDSLTGLPNRRFCSTGLERRRLRSSARASRLLC